MSIVTFRLETTSDVWFCCSEGCTSSLKVHVLTDRWPLLVLIYDEISTNVDCWMNFADMGLRSLKFSSVPRAKHVGIKRCRLFQVLQWPEAKPNCCENGPALGDEDQCLKLFQMFYSNKRRRKLILLNFITCNITVKEMANENIKSQFDSLPM